MADNYLHSLQNTQLKQGVVHASANYRAANKSESIVHLEWDGSFAEFERKVQSLQLSQPFQDVFKILSSDEVFYKSLYLHKVNGVVLMKKGQELVHIERLHDPEELWSKWSNQIVYLDIAVVMSKARRVYNDSPICEIFTIFLFLLMIIWWMFL